MMNIYAEQSNKLENKLKKAVGFDLQGLQRFSEWWFGTHLGTNV